MPDLRKSAAIVGINGHPTRYAPDKSELQIQGESAITAIADAGLTKDDVDGLFTSSTTVRMSAFALADYLNINPSYVDNTSVGGGPFEFHLSHAVTAIAAGRIKCALITYGSQARSGLPVLRSALESASRWSGVPSRVTRATSRWTSGSLAVMRSR